ncbi:uncharacterized protein LOC114329264 isoform X1 [Diabrotica virgifera virgifera]|uniref:Protein kinase domain-containing protein n=2 Tax=Diabrotica virgifera virgifera TaxID=50390 RepID=A0ABM5IJ94_DIAVI|nr:uncharacterized protein LOC114329264 isoform X1 [Diabrotica virgifera virgifera]
MSNKNVKNRKTKINIFESFLESYQYANPNYMKQVKTTLKYCESQVTIASYFVDAKDFEGGDLAFFDGASGLLKGILSINNVKREALMKFNRYNNRYIQNEAAVLAQLKHANVIELLGYIASTKKDNVKKIFLEYMNLHDLARGLEDKEVDLSIENVKKIFIDLATGMEYVHSKKILHRDLRLSHFLYNNKNEYKIGGFDRAVYVGNSNGEYQSPVWESMLRVTKTLTPPEWDEMEKYTYTYKTDVYCMGYCFRIILRKRYPPLEAQLEDIAKELEEFVFDNMFFEIPQCRKDFTKIKTFIQNLKI